MSSLSIQCPKCKNPLYEGVFARDAFSPCPSCATPLQVEIFPAFFRPATAGQAGEMILTEGESSCFYHPQKKASVTCDNCGRFVCSLCDCPLEGRHFCPNCLESSQTKGRIKSIENKRVRYDNIALGLAIIPNLIFYVTLFTAPAVLYLVIRHWKTPLGLTQRTRIRYIIAAIIAMLQITGWVALIIVVSTG